MARFRGPRSKVNRKFGEPIMGEDKVLDKKNYGPGMHGNSRRRRVASEYALQLKEKQKAKLTYGLLERQFRNVFKNAARKKGITGENLLKFLESRLDNVVYRLGIANSRRAARQLVTHKHIKVNGSLVNIPSYKLKDGDFIEVREKSKSMELIQRSLEARDTSYSWLEWDGAKYQGKFLGMPERESIPENINEQLIVELYSK